VLFKEIIGHKELKAKLVSLAQTGRISHTQLFLGSEGCGNLALAIAFSQYVNCLNPGNDDSCGICNSCVKFDKLMHPDLHFTFPTTTPLKLSKEAMEDWRQAIIENPYLSDFDWLQKLNSEANKQGNITSEECRDIISGLGLKSYEAKYKTQIIWQPEYLMNSGNILLKLLEEPPLGTLIILVGNNTEKILATILSRAQLVKVPRISDTDMKAALMERHACDQQKASDVVRLADGNYNMALALLHVEQDGYFDLFSRWMRACYGQKVNDIQPVVDELSTSGREYVKNFLHYTAQMIRSAFIYRFAQKEMLRVNATEIGFLVKFSPFLHDGNLEQITKSLDDAVFHAERNANLKIMFLNLSLYIGRQLKTPMKSV
jgi:DNA polymerase-3 subunit delta'